MRKIGKGNSDRNRIRALLTSAKVINLSYGFMNGHSFLEDASSCQIIPQALFTSEISPQPLDLKKAYLMHAIPLEYDLKISTNKGKIKVEDVWDSLTQADQKVSGKSETLILCTCD
jgi:hypothetical protein